MANATYRRGYCNAYLANSRVIMVDHSAYDTRADIATAAREVNYLAGNWNDTRLVFVGTTNRDRGKRTSIYAIDREI